MKESGREEVGDSGWGFGGEEEGADEGGVEACLSQFMD